MQHWHMLMQHQQHVNMIQYNIKGSQYQKLWIDEVSHMLRTRGMQLHQNEKNMDKITENDTIMDRTLKYAEINGFDCKILQDINFIRKKKKICLLFELLGDDRKC